MQVKNILEQCFPKYVAQKTIRHSTVKNGDMQSYTFEKLVFIFLLINSF